MKKALIALFLSVILLGSLAVGTLAAYHQEQGNNWRAAVGLTTRAQ